MTVLVLNSYQGCRLLVGRGWARAIDHFGGFDASDVVEYVEASKMIDVVPTWE